IPAWVVAGVLSMAASFPVVAAGQEGARIAAEVTNEGGQPIQGAAVQVTGTSIGSLTDAAGRATLGPIAPGSYEVRATQLGYVPQVLRVVANAGQTVSARFVLTPAPAQLGGIQVSVLRPDMLPEAGLGERELREAN